MIAGVRVGSSPVLPTRSRADLLPGVEQTKQGESGPLAVELPLSGALLSRRPGSRVGSS
jgi:hypothetical protein